jgi:hypothetical protein
LTKGARVLAVIFIVLGAVAYLSTTVIRIGSIGNLDNFVARTEVQAAYSNLATASNTFRTSTSQCGQQSDPIQCLDQAASALHNAIQDYSDALARINFPDSVTYEATAAESAAQAASEQVSQLAQSSDGTAYEETAQSPEFSQSLRDLDDSYRTLDVALGG